MSAVEPQVAETSAGAVEFATRGEGAPVLVAHGSPGGYDQGEVMSRFLPEDRFMAIMPSRPGYLGTPLEGREGIDAQADLHAALLDHLEVERAGVLCWSGGGPSTYRLAVSHPERIASIVSLDAVSKAYPRPHAGLTDRLMFTTRPGNWFLRALAAHAPEQMISATLDAEGGLSKVELEQRAKEVFADETKRRFVLDLDATAVQRPPRKAGYENDLDCFEAIEDLELERVQAPALIVQGGADTDVSPDYSELAAERIPGAELLTLDRGTHLAFYTHPEAGSAQARAIELLSRASE